MNRELRNLIVATIHDHPKGSPEELAQLVANNTTQREMNTFYRHLLIGPIRSVAAELRLERDQPPPRPKPKPRPPVSKPSPKLADRRSWWQQQLATEIVVGHRESKLLADCTLFDLQQAVKECDAAIGRLEEGMSFYRSLITQMTNCRVHRVCDLPEPPVREVRPA
ncbi:hypothetical protein ORI20_13875 [Mycobacterium sp. CVI_P3]|uniref:Uncharacterized protein n=1 Tax=Mycobacterium pinniadriaticum TaxID=2994102 RepID=A0ABT3SFY1_9MYCO|nr:hypothetical protein [Mycobacterium pinniadriaticum]MCX2931368.1 hypothetical protein [Mycobacterium pinniadriaticum]MCX2937792.1 hypothetical protein [Mycobacterium pinniadriaticum]